jgi:hypothetical protein
MAGFMFTLHLPVVIPSNPGPSPNSEPIDMSLDLGTPREHNGLFENPISMTPIYFTSKIQFVVQRTWSPYIIFERMAYCAP